MSRAIFVGSELVQEKKGFWQLSGMFLVLIFVVFVFIVSFFFLFFGFFLRLFFFETSPRL